MNYKQYSVELTVTFKEEIGNQYELEHEGDTIFLPCSQVTFEDGEPSEGDECVITIPEWLAIQEDLI